MKILFSDEKLSDIDGIYRVIERKRAKSFFLFFFIQLQLFFSSCIKQNQHEKLYSVACLTHRRYLPSFCNNRYNLLEKSLQLSKTISGFTFLTVRLSSSSKVNFDLIRSQSIASTNSFQIQ